jgi:hypothetical protein
VTYAEAKPYSGKRVKFKTDADHLDPDLPTGGDGLVWWVDSDAVMLEVAPYRPGRGWVAEKLRVPLRRLASLEAAG